MHRKGFSTPTTLLLLCFLAALVASFVYLISPNKEKIEDELQKLAIKYVPLKLADEGGGMTVEVSGETFNMNEDIVINVRPKGNYMVMLVGEEGSAQLVTTLDHSDTEEYATFKLNTASYEPGRAFIRIWRVQWETDESRIPYTSKPDIEVLVYLTRN